MTCGTLHVKVGEQVDPSCLERENTEGRKYCCDQSGKSNGISTCEIEIRGQRNTTGW